MCSPASVQTVLGPVCGDGGVGGREKNGGIECLQCVGRTEAGWEMGGGVGQW